jgi:hypothetical protein
MMSATARNDHVMKAMRDIQETKIIVVKRTRNKSHIGCMLALAMCLVLPSLLSSPAAAQQQTSFPTAEAAAEAFVAALETGTRKAFAPLLGGST